MKKIIAVALIATGIFTAAQSKAQTHKDSTITHKIGKTAKKVGNSTADAATTVGKKTSELAAKGAAAVTDKKYDGKAGPNGETVYIDSKSRYYYVNKSGHRIYTNKSELMDKPSN